MKTREIVLYTLAGMSIFEIIKYVLHIEANLITIIIQK
jgi:hypothetical protein